MKLDQDDQICQGISQHLVDECELFNNINYGCGLLASRSSVIQKTEKPINSKKILRQIDV
jgi:hypothetical protein